MLAGLLYHNGYDVGPDVMPALPDNPKGFFENNAVCALNERILEEAGSSWDDLTLDITADPAALSTRYAADARQVLRDQFDAAENFLIKDPRFCLLYPVWASALQALDIAHRVIIPYRHPLEVAGSLQARDAFPLAKGLQLWCNHLLSAERLTRQAGRAFIGHADLLSDPAFALATALDRIGWPAGTGQDLDTGFIDNSLVHHRTVVNDLDVTLPPPVAELAQRVMNGSFDDAAAFDAIARELNVYRSFFVHRGTQYSSRNRRAARRQEQQLEWFRSQYQMSQQRLGEKAAEIAALRKELHGNAREIARIVDENCRLRAAAMPTNSRPEETGAEATIRPAATLPSAPAPHQAQGADNVVAPRSAARPGLHGGKRPLRILVACDDMIPSGGLLRFERVAKAIRSDGHSLVFVPLAERISHGAAFTAPVMSFETASSQHWDAVMIPGAGFPQHTIERFSRFRAGNFGLRVQHILNDQTRREAFLAVNRAFLPDLVVFNNNHWPVGSFTEFGARQFRFLYGGVDLQVFRQRDQSSAPRRPVPWIIGGQATKNPEPLIRALDHLGDNVQVRLFGPVREDLRARYAAHVDARRLLFTGLLNERQVADFYAGVNCVVMSEAAAGWANIAAEALASGVPLICTPHGTQAFATHNETALLVDTPDPAAIAAAVRRLMDDPALCRRLVANGHRAISTFSWTRYSDELLDLLQRRGSHDYYWAPELGLHGKWPREDRLTGLAPLLARSGGCSVLDLGAAEGIVSFEFLKHGAMPVHGVELDEQRVHAANRLCADNPACRFWTANLLHWNEFLESARPHLRDSYDIVLYLGLHQHLPGPDRLAILDRSVQLAARYFAFRAPDAVHLADGIDARLQRAGFRPLQDSGHLHDRSHLGQCHVYERVAGNSGVA